jgi:hypothetical protein
VPDSLLAALLLVPFYGATLAVEKLPPRVGWIPLALLCAASVLVFHELARYDHGHPDLLFAVGYVGAPVGAILGGASWGTRRFYGWPDLGPHPSRLALWCLTILLAVMLGTRQRADDLLVTKGRAEDLRRQLIAWRDAHAGAWPATLDAVGRDTPRTALGAWDPPPFALRATPAALAFPVSARTAFVLRLDDGTWLEERRDPTPSVR